MKKIFLPFIAITIMTFFVACSNEELLPEATGEAEANTETTIEETRTLSITATIPGKEKPTTRVTLERDSLDIVLKWQAGDRLQFAFVQGENKVKDVLTLTAEDNITNDGKTVTFNITLPTNEDFDPNENFDLYGLYSNYRDTDDGLPNGLDTILGEDGSGLSEGQAQRIAIARSLLRPGKILLLDEATSALDSETEQTFLKNLKQTIGDRTILFITHNAEIAEFCDYQYNLTPSI